jgi:hypothetical protein
MTVLSLPRRPRKSKRRARPASAPGVITGRVIQADPAGAAVDFPGNQTGAPVSARTLAPARQLAPGSEVVLAFERGDWGRPIILGVLESPVPAATAQVDGQRLVLSAEQEVVLRCGEASLTLTRAGKVLIRGNYVLSRSSGPNRIKGASVEIN